MKLILLLTLMISVVATVMAQSGSTPNRLLVFSGAGHGVPGASA